MAMDARRYPLNWKEISLDIRVNRAKGRCEWCGAENHKPHPITGGMVTLTVAHLGTPLPDGTPTSKHDKMDVRPENLAALCNRCHLRFDIDEHMEHARETRSRKKRERASALGQLSLFGDVS